jgi:hypothetical protein
MLLSTGKEPSLDALVRLGANLKQRHEICRESRYGELRQKAEWLFPITTRVWTAFYEKALDRQLDYRQGR